MLMIVVRLRKVKRIIFKESAYHYTKILAFADMINLCNHLLISSILKVKRKAIKQVFYSIFTRAISTHPILPFPPM